jgi:hypothetical protein
MQVMQVEYLHEIKTPSARLPISIGMAGISPKKETILDINPLCRFATSPPEGEKNLKF